MKNDLATMAVAVPIKIYRDGQKKYVLGCVIPPAGAVAISRNLGQTVLANSVGVFLAFTFLLRTVHAIPNDKERRLHL